jgi:hypothetical protein
MPCRNAPSGARVDSVQAVQWADFPTSPATVKAFLHQCVSDAISALQANGGLPHDAAPAFVVERTRNREHGDFATNAALCLSNSTVSSLNRCHSVSSR